MKHQSSWAIPAACAIFLLTAVAVSPVEGEAIAAPDRTWFEDAEGLTAGLERAEAEGRPVLLYFYTDWCGYCRQLEAKLLEESTVMDYTDHLVKIRINPERGREEKALAGRYGVRGFPTVLVQPAGSDGPKKIARMVVDRGRKRLMTPDEYVDTLIRATGERFGAS